MIVTPSTPDAGCRELGNQRTQPLWTIIASSSGSTTNQLARTAIAKCEAAWLPVPKHASINGEQSNFSIQTSRPIDIATQMLRRNHARLRFSFCNSCRKLHLGQLRPKHCDVSAFAHFPTYPIGNHLAGPQDVLARPLQSSWAQQRRLLRLGRAAKRTREGDAQLKAHFRRDGTFAIGAAGSEDRPCHPRGAPQSS